MVPIFIASNSSYTGKTFLSLGLALNLSKQGYSVGYLKPFGRRPVKRGANLYDEDAVFIKETLSLPEPLDAVSPFVYSYETENHLFDGNVVDTRKRIMDALGMQKQRDFVIIGGAGDLLEGSTLNLDARSLIGEMKAYVLMVESWRGEASIDALVGGSRLFGERFLGGVINRVKSNVMHHVRDKIKPFVEKKGIAIFGVFQKDSLLESISVRQLNETLKGNVVCCAERLEEFVENFSIGAMDVDSALTHFRRIANKAVITGAHRADIQLAAMETSTKCIILTGGFHVNDVIIGKAQVKGIPLIAVQDDTFTTIEKIESVLGRIGIREEKKVARVGEILEDFDYARLLKALPARP